MQTFLLFLLLDHIFLTKESPDYFRPNSFLNAYLEPLQTERIRREYSGIRIKLFYDNSIPKDSVYRSWTKQAIDFFSSSLKVKPVNSQIFIERECDSSIVIDFRDRKTAKIETYCDGRCSRDTYCSSIPIPEDHLNQCKHCSTNEPSSCRKEQNKGSGIEDADLIIYIGSLPKDHCNNSGTVAYGFWCAKEGTLDRPIAGGLNICPSTMQDNTITKAFIVETLIHEVMHILGFSPPLYEYYRDENGNPLTARNEFGKPIGEPNKLGLIVNDTVMKFVKRDWEVRGNKRKTKEAALIVTPTVVQEVRAHFNCPTLEGAELEDSDETYSHWEARLFHGEVMEAESAINMPTVFSRISFALLQDTGWYQVNYSYAEPLEFGKNLGCDFCTKSCKYWMDRRSDRLPYCNKMKDLYCTVNRKAVGKCKLLQYATEPKYQYFEHIENVPDYKTGFYGGEANADFCPIISPFKWANSGKGSECIQESNTPNVDQNLLLESFGQNARCFEYMTNTWKVVQFPESCDPAYVPHVIVMTNLPKAGCYKYSCEDGWLHIHVHNRKYTCFQKGQIIEVQIFNLITRKHHFGTIICPPCEDICTNNTRCNPDNSYEAQQYKYEKDECIESVVNKPTSSITLTPTTTTEWIPFWVTNAYSETTQEWSTQSTNQNWPITTETTTTEITTTSSTTSSTIAESTPEAPQTIAEKTDNTVETKWTQESTFSVEVQTKRTKATDSSTTVSDSKPVASRTLLIIIGFIALSLTFIAIVYFLFISEKASPSERKGKETKVGKEERRGKKGRLDTERETHNTSKLKYFE